MDQCEKRRKLEKKNEVDKEEETARTGLNVEKEGKEEF
jgi:hypothetical protein